MNRQELQKKVKVTAETLLYENGYVSPVDLLMKMDRLSKKDYEDWRFGRIHYLERVCVGNLSKLSLIMKELRKFVHDKNLRPSRRVYKKWGKGKKIILQFSKTGIPKIEEAYATSYLGQKSKKQIPKSESESI